MPLPKHAAPIALFDSGAGGIGVLQEVKKLLPREQLLFFGDTANAPYGEKSPDEICALVLRVAEGLIPHIKALVLACNTATAVAVNTLRARYPTLPIIGMEPALHPAIEAARCSTSAPTVWVLATAATLQSSSFAALCQKQQKNATVVSLPAPGIVRLVEAGLADSPQMDSYLQALFAPFDRLPDALVLGCTHFPFAKHALRRVLGDSVPFFDGAAGTARELRRRLEHNGLLAPATASGAVLLRTSAPAALPLLTRLLTATM